MANLISFGADFKRFDYRRQFQWKSALSEAYGPVSSASAQDTKDSIIDNCKSVYPSFGERVVREVKTASQNSSALLQIDLKKHYISPETWGLTVIAQALYREYGIELKQVDALSRPEVLVVSWEKDNPLFNSSGSKFQMFRGRNFLVDYQIKCNGQGFAAHKLVLAATCPFFEKYLAGGFQNSNEHVIPFVDAKVSTVSVWLDYLYTGDITITQETVYDLIRFSRYYGLGHLEQKCFNRLCELVTAKNLVQFIAYGLEFNREGLEAALVKSVQSEIELETLEAFLTLIRDYEIQGLEEVCLKQIGDNDKFSIGYRSFDATKELLDIADTFEFPGVRSICNQIFERQGTIEAPEFDFVIKWLELAGQHNLTHVMTKCACDLSALFKTSREMKDSTDYLGGIKQVLQIADQFNLVAFKEFCSKYLIDEIAHNVDKVLLIAQKFSLESVKQACEQVKKTHSE